MDNNIFKKRLNQLGIGKQVDAAIVVTRSQKVIHEKFGNFGDENLKVISYKNGILKIASSSSVWSAEGRQLLLQLQVEPVKKVIFTLSSFESE